MTESDKNTLKNRDSIDWLLELSDEYKEQFAKEEFADWLEQDEDNASDFIDKLKVWDELAELGADVDVDELLARDDANSSVVHAEFASTKRPSSVKYWLSAVAATLVIGLAINFFTSDITPVETMLVSTSVGEQRKLQLDDGSIAHLNTSSQIEVSLQKEYRLISMNQGEVLFDVASDKSRPFYIDVQDTLIRVVGTQFNVRSYSDRTEIAVLEGKVAVSGADFSRELLSRQQVNDYILEAGDVLSFPNKGSGIEAELQRNSDLQQAIAWLEQKLVFDNEPLIDIVAEFNRYRAQPISLVDPELGALRMTGIFHNADTDSLKAVLESMENIQWRTNPVTGAIVISRASLD